MSGGVQLLRDHVECFNGGVRSGDFGPMVDGFAEDAVMEFEGVPAGPFVGRDAIEAAYGSQPPDDEVEVLDATEQDGVVVAQYVWSRDRGSVAGEMRLTPTGDRIQRLVVTFRDP